MPVAYNTKVGDRYGTRTITAFLRDRDSDGHLRVRWRCDCGATGSGGLKSIRHTANCQKCRNQYQEGRPVHGHCTREGRTHLYDSWANMMQRVRAVGRNARWYAGISACEAWHDFDGFRQWAEANGYAKGLSLERKRPSGNYEPGNCEWITKAENTRRAKEPWRRQDSFPIEMMWGTA